MSETATIDRREQSCRHLRALLAERGMMPREETISLDAAREWLAGQCWAWPDVTDALSLIAGRPGRLIEGRGWRLIATLRPDMFELVTMDRYAEITLART